VSRRLSSGPGAADWEGRVNVIYVPGLAAALFAVWFALSGQTSPLFLAYSFFSVAAVLVVCLRLGILQKSASPYHRAHQLAGYTFWLLGEILRSNIAVLRIILFAPGRVAPGFVAVPVPSRDEFALSLFANSITLTPGTVTVEASEKALLVHSLIPATEESFEDMGLRSARAAGGRSS